MPELPEVETIVRYLNPRLTGKKILDYKFYNDHGFKKKFNGQNAKKYILNKKIKSVKRFGKKIAIELSPQTYLVFHLMMTGKLLLNPKDHSKHDRLYLLLSGNNRLVFNDMRKFGTCQLRYNSKQLIAQPDPLSITENIFQNLIKKYNKTIKNLLIDQKIISGIGNIYANEILWMAKIHPTRKSNSLTNPEIKKLYQACKNILNISIAMQGATFKDYKKPDGTSGNYYSIRKVYKRENEKCDYDNAIIKRIKLNNRSTYFCPKHQL